MAVPRAEQSGSHRVVDVEVGDVRQAIAALAGVSKLARAEGVGSRELRDALSELRETCLALPGVVAGAVIPACDVVALATGLAEDARKVLDALVIETRRVATVVLAALHPIAPPADRRLSSHISQRRARDPAPDGAPVDALDSAPGQTRDSACDGRGRRPTAPLGARTRLALQNACDVAVADLARVRAAIELLQRASISEPIPVALDDLFRELDADGLSGPSVELTVSGAASAAVAVHPRLGAAVLLRALAQVRQRTPGATFSAIARASDGRIEVDLHLRVRSDPSGAILHLTLPEPAPWDERLLRLAAASLAAPLHFDARGARLDLLRAST